MGIRTEKQVIAELSTIPPVSCDLKVGDFVTYTNDNGVSFPEKKIIGFEPNLTHGRFIYLSKDSYWFPVTLESVKKE